MTVDLKLDFSENRYSRLELISWWNQQKLKNSKVMVVGAGAIGNEVIKNLALLGIGKIYIVDMDHIENSNLSRSVLYRSKDELRYKAEVAAEQAMDLNPDIKAIPLVENIVSGIGLGLFREVDLVIGGLDNREARMEINQNCWLTNTTWIDGAIEELRGVARVFKPSEGPCYECTMNKKDYELVNQRRSCSLLTRGEMKSGKVPTTPTVSSIIAGVQVQEALKLLHSKENFPNLIGQGFVFNGLTNESYLIEYQIKEECFAHEMIEELEVLESACTSEMTVEELLKKARDKLGDKAVLELNQELVTKLSCSSCGKESELFKSLYQVTESEAKCPECDILRDVELTHRIIGDEPYLGRTLSELGIPSWDIIAARAGMQKVYFELAGDKF